MLNYGEANVNIYWWN